MPQTVIVDTQTVVVGSGGGTVVRVSQGGTNVTHAPAVDQNLQVSPATQNLVIGAGTPGPAGPPGPAGDFNGTTDGVPEGAANLYFTVDRASAVAVAAVDSGIALHMLHPDPHTQYIDGDRAGQGGVAGPGCGLKPVG